MKVFVRDKTKKYTCDICQSQFNWSEECWQYGTAEDAEAVLCSTKCKDKHNRANAQT